MARKAWVLFLFLAAMPCFGRDKDWKAGVAKVLITPRSSIWMGGYAARSRASEGVAQDLYAAALALDDGTGKRAVLVTADLRRVTAGLSDAVARRVAKRHRVARDRIIFNASHTHSGPVISEFSVPISYAMSIEESAVVDAYTRELEDNMVAAVDAAMKDLKPVRLSFGRAEALFAKNRRAADGPVAHDVPVLRVEDRRGRLQAIVFGYACHNTTVGGTAMYKIHGDYAGVAKQWLETQYPGTLALFVAGCGGDANPEPRGTLEHAEQHGAALGRAVTRALGGVLEPVHGPLRCAMDIFPVSFAEPPSREQLEARLRANSVYARRHAAALLKTLDREGRLPADYPYPLQVWEFGSDLTLIALAGEVVVDYDLRLRKELAGKRIWVSGYNNDVFAYIPSLRILREGGYEGGGAMVFHGFPAPFAPTIEDVIIGKVHELMKRAR